MTAPNDAMDPEETLARWRAEEASVRARLQTAPGVASPAQVVGRSGLQILQALLAGEIPPPPMAVTLDFTLLRIEPGFAVSQGQPRFSHYNPMGTVHGGWLATMLDTAMGCAVHSTLPAGHGLGWNIAEKARQIGILRKRNRQNNHFNVLHRQLLADSHSTEIMGRLNMHGACKRIEHVADFGQPVILSESMQLTGITLRYQAVNFGLQPRTDHEDGGDYNCIADPP